MIVAFAAAHGGTHPDGGSISHSVGRVLGQVLFGLCSAFASCHQQPVVTGRDSLFVGRVRQQVTGQLLRRKLVIRHVAAKRVNHIVTVHPDITMIVTVDAVCVGVTHKVQPQPCHAFRVVMR